MKTFILILFVSLCQGLFCQIINTPPGVVVTHLVKSEGKYIGSPSLLVLPGGEYLASHDYFGPNSNTGKMGVTSIFKSLDKGQSWNQISIIEGQYWSNLFFFENNLYILGVYSGHGNIVIRKSSDEGVTWTVPTNGRTGLLFEGNYHTAPSLISIYNGRIWRAFEDANAIDSKLPNRYGVVMISADIERNLLDSSNWKMTNCLVQDKDYMAGKFLGWLEGQALVTKDNRLINILRVHIHPGTQERAAIVNTTCDGENIYFQPATNFVNLPGASKKFVIRYDKETKRYWTLVNNIPEGYESAYPASVRNYLSLSSSVDLYKWVLHETVLSHPDRFKHGFQYVDWAFEGDDIIFLSRTAYDDDFGGADSFHNANYLTFHRIENYKAYVENK